METAVDTPELQGAARAYADAGLTAAALADALAAEATAVGAWSYGASADAAGRFFTTLAWAARTGGAELSALSARLRASADGYDVTELALRSYGIERPGPPG